MSVPPPSPPPWRLSLIFGLGGVITPKWIPMTPQLPQGRKFCIQMSHTKEMSLVLSSPSIVIQPPRSYPPNSYHAILAALYVRSCSRLLCGEHDWHSSHCIARAATRGIWQSRGAKQLARLFVLLCIRNVLPRFCAHCLTCILFLPFLALPACNILAALGTHI